MKKILALLLVISMCFGLCSCTLDIDSILKTKKANKATSANVVKGNIVAEDDPIYAEIEDSLPCIYKFIEYNHILGNTIEYDDVNTEDFWNIVALIAGSYPKIADIADIDVAGTYHIKWANMDDLAKTFLYRSIYEHDFPNYRSSYSASADPGSGIIDLVPLNVDNYDASVERMARDTNDPNIDYIVYIKLSGRGDDLKCHHYAVYIAEWDKYVGDVYGEEDDRKGEHYLPYMVVGYNYIGSDERVVETVNESEN